MSGGEAPREDGKRERSVRSAGRDRGERDLPQVAAEGRGPSGPRLFVECG